MGLFFIESVERHDESFLSAGSWGKRGYVLWKICGPDGQLKCHLFHICRNLEVREDRAEYLDLLLDLLIDADGQVTVLDWEEVGVCAAKGVIGQQDLAWIARERGEITDNMGRLISDFDVLLRT
jgi:predicted RNA-binding protein associated with RNAse of E/G family